MTRTISGCKTNKTRRIVIEALAEPSVGKILRGNTNNCSFAIVEKINNPEEKPLVNFYGFNANGICANIETGEVWNFNKTIETLTQQAAENKQKQINILFANKDDQSSDNLRSTCAINHSSIILNISKTKELDFEYIRYRRGSNQTMTPKEPSNTSNIIQEFQTAFAENLVKKITPTVS